METYWFTPSPRSSVASDDKDCSTGSEQSLVVKEQTAPQLEQSCPPSGEDHLSVEQRERTNRLIDWNVDVLLRLIKQILAMRPDNSAPERPRSLLHVGDGSKGAPNDRGGTVLDEVQEIIRLPKQARRYHKDPAGVIVPPAVVSQLREYVRLVASMYRDNSFHNFEHASHVTQSVLKLMSRVVTAHDIDYNELQYKLKGEATKRHEYTFGITSDPITQFACAFSALIHDLNHPGVPNMQLVKEKADIAVYYKNKSVAEQNSVDLAWELLMEDTYGDLRACIYSTTAEKQRFRQLVVNAVMATDIADKELAQLRRNRWDRAFEENNSSLDGSTSSEEDSDRNATIVIEHLIQASDVAHTMQHWHVFLKWNEKLFHEMYRSYLDGRSEKDPSEGWYQGEMGFFNHYVIPLAKKLKECGVFGVASDEYLNYALANRREWEAKGISVVKSYLSKYN